jgi:hypothetical protein
MNVHTLSRRLAGKRKSGILPSFSHGARDRTGLLCPRCRTASELKGERSGEQSHALARLVRRSSHSCAARQEDRCSRVALREGAPLNGVFPRIRCQREMIQPFRSEYQRLSSAGLEDRETSSYPFRCRIERCANHFVVIRAKHNTCGGLGHYLLPAELTGFGPAPSFLVLASLANDGCFGALARTLGRCSCCHTRHLDKRRHGPAAQRQALSRLAGRLGR